ncbi:hypothetical protein BD309DRAFT_957970, partial [Dichomitus squalens]
MLYIFSGEKMFATFGSHYASGILCDLIDFKRTRVVHVLWISIVLLCAILSIIRLLRRPALMVSLPTAMRLKSRPV